MIFACLLLTIKAIIEQPLNNKALEQDPLSHPDSQVSVHSLGTLPKPLVLACIIADHYLIAILSAKVPIKRIYEIQSKQPSLY